MFFHVFSFVFDLWDLFFTFFWIFFYVFGFGKEGVFWIFFYFRFFSKKKCHFLRGGRGLKNMHF